MAFSIHHSTAQWYITSLNPAVDWTQQHRFKLVTSSLESIPYCWKLTCRWSWKSYDFSLLRSNEVSP